MKNSILKWKFKMTFTHLYHEYTALFLKIFLLQEIFAPKLMSSVRTIKLYQAFRLYETFVDYSLNTFHNHINISAIYYISL